MSWLRKSAEQVTEEYWREYRLRTVAQQEAKKLTYEALKAKALPVPKDLREEVEGSRIGFGDRS